MADFHQTELISTLHRLKTDNIVKLEDDLRLLSKQRPLALVLPCLYEELKRDAIKTILKELKDADYIKEIVISLSRANREEFEHARSFFNALPQKATIIWHEAEWVDDLFKLLKKNGLSISKSGKGMAIWIAHGYVLANKKSHVVVSHDCDIISYTRELLVRLCYPIVNPNLDYEFSKGYYTRITNRMYGRAMRIFFTPLIRTMKKIIGGHPFLEYLDSFRYALSGEFAMITDLARINRIPSDWGLEIGILSEVYRNVSTRRICQVDLCDNYEHKHQVVSKDDPNVGLFRMSIDISKMLFRTLANEGILLSKELFNTLIVVYLKVAQDAIKRYSDDAFINNIYYDRHEEELAAEVFTEGIKLAADAFRKDSLGSSLIPNWNRVTSAIPNFLDRLKMAVDRDNE